MNFQTFVKRSEAFFEGKKRFVPTSSIKQTVPVLKKCTRCPAMHPIRKYTFMLIEIYMKLSPYVDVNHSILIFMWLYKHYAFLRRKINYMFPLYLMFSEWYVFFNKNKIYFLNLQRKTMCLMDFYFHCEILTKW